ncbi:MAG: TetR/AcrR family transcriptional regulator [Acidimicrobiales bacterium]
MSVPVGKDEDVTDEAGATSPRGRPPARDVKAKSHPGLPIQDPLQALPPVARWVLQCARRVLIERGFGALTLENVALESQETKASIQRYFGSKTGLIEALFDSLMHDDYLAMKSEAERLPPGDERVRTYLRGLCGIASDVDASRASFEISPHALRDPALHERLAQMYAWYRELTASTCGLTGSSLDEERQHALATLILATLDGLSFQIALDPAKVDPTPVFDLLYELIHGTLRI